jgi:hypothetical protein
MKDQLNKPILSETVSVRLSRDDVRRLELQADDQSRSVSNLVRVGLREFLDYLDSDGNPLTSDEGT